MTTSATSVRTDTGVEIPFEWVYEGGGAHEWVRDTEHWTTPMPPLERWLHAHLDPGVDRAWAEVGMEPPAWFYRFQLVGPFLYARESPWEPERMVRSMVRYHEVGIEHGGALRFWEDFCRPRIEQVCREVSELPVDTPLDDVAERCGYGFHQTFTSLSPLFEAGMRLAMLLGPVFGEGTELLSQELMQGGDNQSQSIDAEVWALTNIARETPAAADRIRDDAGAATIDVLREDPAARAFVAAFDAMMERHGSRSQGWELTNPTWRERPEALLSLVQAQLRAPAVSPEEVAAGSAARREAALQRALEALPPDKHEELRQALADLDGYVSIREGRAYWQMMLMGEARLFALRIGATLVERGRIEQAEDVMFLEPDEITSTTGDLRALVAERRAAWDAWWRVEPPPRIGTPTVRPEPASTGDVLRGSAASRGVVTGPARVMRTLDERADVRPGDVLVCVMTTPAWTPLFGVAAGIVAETGGALSHPAITAREYGIPAVVGLKDATTRIRDGETITLDGGAGTVTLHR